MEVGWRLIVSECKRKRGENEGKVKDGQGGKVK